jgi:protoporphyrinogen/coproporphyrinogen III oxidase
MTEASLSNGLAKGRRVAVVGGGISGLVAARDLQAGGAAVTLYEPGPLGGKLQTEDFAGHRVELGADAFLTRVPEAVALCRELDLEPELIPPAAGRAALWWGDRLVTMPSDLVLGAPARLGGVARSRILSPAGLARAALDEVLPATPLAADVSVRELIAARFGPEVADRLVDPLVGGIHAGRTAELSAAATTPQLLAAARKQRSLGAALRAATARPAAAAGAPAAPVFLAPRGGLAVLVDRLVADLVAGGATIDRRPVQAVYPAPSGTGPSETDPSGTGLSGAGAAGTGTSETGTAGTGTSVIVDGASVAFDGAVLALPAATAAALLGPAAPVGLAGIPTASVTMTLLAYRSAELPVPAGLSGFLVPRLQGHLMTACSFASTKWPHWSGPETTLLRVSVGRDGDDRQDHLDDAELAAAVIREVRAVLHTSAAPIESRVIRWPGSFPQYRVGHLDLVARIEADLRRRAPAVALAGASYRGSGIPACIRSGRDAAAGVLAALAGAPV